MSLFDELQAQIDAPFCHDELIPLSKICFRALDEQGANWTSEDYLLIHAIGQGSWSVADRVDALAPGTKSRHDESEASASPALKEAVAVFVSGTERNKCAAAAALLRRVRCL